jgi:hypothetical protein
MGKKKCKGCKNKPMGDLNGQKKEEETLSPLAKTLIVIYTVLAAYGVVRLVIDLNSLVTILW